MGGLDMSGLQKMIAKLDGIARGDMTRILLKNMAAEALTQTQLGFRESRDPYGIAWLPPKLRAGQPLRDTGRLANSYVSAVEGMKVRVSSNLIYTGVHQDGATITPKTAKWLTFSAGRGGGKQWFRLKSVTIPARPMVPNDDLPPIWAKAIEEATRTTWKTFMK